VYDPSYKFLLRGPIIRHSVRFIVQNPSPRPDHRAKCTIHRTNSRSGARSSSKVYDLSYKFLLQGPSIERVSSKVYDLSYKFLLRSPIIEQSVRSIVQIPAPRPTAATIQETVVTCRQLHITTVIITADTSSTATDSVPGCLPPRGRRP
jgi:hypothetical protein